MEEIDLRQSPDRVMKGDVVHTILNELFENYTVDEMNEILLNTLYRAMANPDQDITRQEFNESVHLVTQITETFRKIELAMPNLN